MGITGLLPFLEKATKPCHIAEFRGSTVVIDTYCWLHKGANACALQLAQGEETNMYVNYCLKYIKMLQSYDIRPILVFDGKNLPAKADTEAKRRESRNKAKQRAAELLRLGKTDEARSYLKQCINITPEMASAVIKECHKINVDCIVAPYESDAQLAFFNIKGIADIVITEDSDLLLFGCNKVLYKLDLQGCGHLVEADKIPLSMKLRPDKYTFDKFRYMCILSGCDYVDSLHGVGLKKALKFFSLTEETNPEIFLGNVPRYLNMRHLHVSDEYKENFLKANATFLHQIVFDPFKKKLVPLYDPDTCGTNKKYCQNAGEVYDNETAYQVALGNLHPTTHKQLDNWCPVDLGSTSIWSGVYKKTLSRKEQKATFKNYFQVERKEENVDVVDVEGIKIEEDEKINSELIFYGRKSEENKTDNVEEEPIKKETTVAEKTSPLLKSNPFIKRFSRFPRTQSGGNVVVKSRYFSSNISEKIEDVKCDIENIEINSQEIKSEPSNSVITDNCDNDTTVHIDITDVNESLSRVKGVQESDLILKKTGPCLQSNSQKTTDEYTNSTKRKQLGPCRSIGLKRTKSEGGQQKISEFFDKFRKK